MTKTERIKALLEGKKLDTQAINLWKHFPPYDEDPQELVKKIIQFQDRFQWDFVKVTYQGLFSIQDWGSTIKWPERDNVWPETCSSVGVVTDFSIKKDEDWAKLNVLPMDQGSMAATIAAAKGVVDHFKGQVPVVITIFNPLTTAIKMSGDKMFVHMRRNPELFHKGLEVICQTTIKLVEEMAKLGADGIFFASQLGTYDKMSVAEYEEFGRPYDLRVLEAAQGMWFNIMHMHGNAPMFDIMSQYPVAALNWHDQLVDISLADARKKSDKLLIGGVEELKVLGSATEEELKAHLKAAMDQVPDGRLILAPGCCVPLYVPEDRLATAREVLATI